MSEFGPEQREAARARRREIMDSWSRLCGCCDAGLPTNCTCPTSDPRSAISVLLDDADDLDAALDVAYQDNQRAWRDFEEMRHEAMQQREAREAADIEIARLREQVEVLQSALDSSIQPPPSPDCPANNGSQCCGYPDLCRAALSGPVGQETEK